ncbi:MAG: CBS domain-containing protein [Chloroflexi bacterium]|nr:CBS domain-containing protein [Chloroflexota bacterium]
MDRLVRDIMRIGVPTCTRESSLVQVAAMLARDQVDALIVMDEYGACGVISQSDLVRVYPRNYALLRAQDIMTERIVNIAPDTSVTAAANLMQEEHVHQVFIMHEHPGPSRPSAAVTMRAIVREMAGLEPERVERKVLASHKQR